MDHGLCDAGLKGSMNGWTDRWMDGWMDELDSRIPERPTARDANPL